MSDVQNHSLNSGPLNLLMNMILLHLTFALFGRKPKVVSKVEPPKSKNGNWWNFRFFNKPADAPSIPKLNDGNLGKFGSSDKPADAPSIPETNVAKKSHTLRNVMLAAGAVAGISAITGAIISGTQGQQSFNSSLPDSTAAQNVGGQPPIGTSDVPSTSTASADKTSQVAQFDGSNVIGSNAATGLSRDTNGVLLQQ